MKSTRTLGVIFITRTLFLCPFATPDAFAQVSTGGAVEGRVFDASTGDALRNARVGVEGTRNETLTNENGDFRLSNISPGEVMVKATYGTLGQQSIRVTIATGSIQRQDFNLPPRGAADVKTENVVRLEEFTVEARELSAQAAAIEEQRAAANIKN